MRPKLAAKTHTAFGNSNKFVYMKEFRSESSSGPRSFHKGVCKEKIKHKRKDFTGDDGFRTIENRKLKIPGYFLFV